jgi:hypothetical protein
MESFSEPRVPESEEQLPDGLAQTAQNPVANVISLPFQNNTNFNVGPLEKTQNILNIQPVIPFSLGKNWNLITRTILPVISQPALFPGEDRTFGKDYWIQMLQPCVLEHWKLVVMWGHHVVRGGGSCRLPNPCKSAMPARRRSSGIA